MLLRLLDERERHNRPLSGWWHSRTPERLGYHGQGDPDGCGRVFGMDADHTDHRRAVSAVVTLATRSAVARSAATATRPGRDRTLFRSMVTVT